MKSAAGSPGPERFGADAGIIRRQHIIGQARPVAPDRGIEALGTLRIDGVIFLVNPFHIGAEAHAPGEIERDVDAEPAIDGGGINQARESRAPGAAEIIALGIDERRDQLLVETLRRLCQPPARRAAAALTMASKGISSSATVACQRPS